VAAALVPAAAVRPPLAAPLGAAAPTLEDLDRTLAARLAEGRAAIRSFFEAGGAPEQVHRELAELVDELAGQLAAVRSFLSARAAAQVVALS